MSRLRNMEEFFDKSRYVNQTLVCHKDQLDDLEKSSQNLQKLSKQSNHKQFIHDKVYNYNEKKHGVRLVIFRRFLCN